MRFKKGKKPATVQVPKQTLVVHKERMKLKDKFAKIARSRGFKAVIASIVALIAAFAIYKKVKNGRSSSSQETISVKPEVVGRIIQEESAMTKEIESAVNVVETTGDAEVMDELTHQNKRSRKAIGNELYCLNDDITDPSTLTASAKFDDIVRDRRDLASRYMSRQSEVHSVMNETISEVGGFQKISREVCVDIDNAIELLGNLADRSMQKMFVRGADPIEIDSALEHIRNHSKETGNRSADFAARWDLYHDRLNL